MDNRAQVREFLISRRERISPAQAGLPAYGGSNRRVKGLRREEVALLAYTAAAGTPTADSLKMLASWAVTAEQAGDLPAHA
jgi:hypothetical protein